MDMKESIGERFMGMHEDDAIVVLLAFVCSVITLMGLLVMIPWESLWSSCVSKIERRGMSAQSVESLSPSVLCSSLGYSGGDNNESVCAICLSGFMGEQVMRVIPNCKHVFHKECIDTWLSHTSTCPTCRSPLYACASFYLFLQPWELLWKLTSRK